MIRRFESIVRAMTRQCAKKPWLILLFVLIELTIVSLEAIAVSEFDSVGNGVGLLVGKVAVLGVSIRCVVAAWSSALGIWLAVGATMIQLAIDLLFLMLHLDRLDEKTGVTAILYIELVPPVVAALSWIVSEVRKCLPQYDCSADCRKCWTGFSQAIGNVCSVFFGSLSRAAKTLTVLSSIGLAVVAMVVLDSSRRYPFVYTILGNLFACIFIFLPWTPGASGHWFYCMIFAEGPCCPLSRSYDSARLVGHLLMFWLPEGISIVGSLTAIVVAKTVDDYLDRPWLITNLWVFSFGPAILWLLATGGFKALKKSVCGLVDIFCPATTPVEPDEADEEAGGRPKAGDISVAE